MNICEDTEVAKNIKHNYQDYHLGFPDYCMVSQSVAWIIDELQLSPKIEYVGGDRGWIGDNPFVFLDVSKALSTGWRPEHSIEASIRETARWLFENQWIFTSRV
jgi:UDP-glucose 4-epimerase